MRLLSFVGFLFILFVAVQAASADPPDLQKGLYIYDGAVPLSVDRHSAPTAVDWNNDGKKDLVVGQFTYGYIWLYLNKGTDLNPVFSGGSLVESNGAPITTTYG